MSVYYEDFLASVEQPYFEELMRLTKGNQCEITRLSGLARGTVRKKLKHYGFIPSRYNGKNKYTPTNSWRMNHHE